MKIMDRNFLLRALIPILATGLALAPGLAGAQTAPNPQPGPFAKGKVRVGVYGGAGTSLDQTYFILGGGVGYYLTDGLEIGGDFEGWLGEDPTIWKVTPQVRYVLWQMEQVRPYFGAFWRQTFIGDPYEDYSSYGGRAGVAYRNGGNYVAVGIVHERFNDCVGGDCDSTYPEFGFWIAF